MGKTGSRKFRGTVPLSQPSDLVIIFLLDMFFKGPQVRDGCGRHPQLRGPYQVRAALAPPDRHTQSHEVEICHRCSNVQIVDKGIF